MRKYISLLIVISFIFGMSSCDGYNVDETVYSPDEDYEIKKENENFYIEIKQSLKTSSNNDSNASIKTPSIKFDSVEQMRTKIVDGKLTQDEKETMARFPTDDNGKILTLDFSNIHNPIIPNDTTISRVSWNGDHYTVNFKGYNCEYGFFERLSEDKFNQKHQEKHVDFIKKAHKIVDITEEAERNATKYHYWATDTNELIKITYEIKNEFNSLMISETYALQSNMEFTFESSSEKPVYIEILGTSQDCFFYFFLEGFKERPSVEWLSSFGVEKLKID